ncbi:MAG: MerR family transcriptional regulator [Pseudomonadota bacterium]
MLEKKPKTTSKLSKNGQRKEVTASSLPPIPDKRYFTIGEAAQLCGVKPHVLRYWEIEFLQLKPSKRRGNRRYYQAKDVQVVRQIRKLLYEDGFTIEGARYQLGQTPQESSASNDVVIKKLIADLEQLLQNLKTAEQVV